MTSDRPRPWKLDIDVTNPSDNDFSFAFETQEKAQAELDNIIKRGYVIHDVTGSGPGDKDRVDMFPLGAVRAIRIRYRE